MSKRRSPTPAKIPPAADFAESVSRRIDIDRTEHVIKAIGKVFDAERIGAQNPAIVALGCLEFAQMSLSMWAKQGGTDLGSLRTWIERLVTCYT